MYQADGQSMKLSDMIIVSSWMGDPIGTWVINLIFFLIFFFTQNLLLMFLKILVQNFCISIEACSMGIEEVYS